MAEQWCLEYGVLPAEQAKKAFKRLQKRKAEKGNSPKRSSSSGDGELKKKKKVKKEMVLDDVMVDAGMDAGGGDGIGIAGL